MTENETICFVNIYAYRCRGGEKLFWFRENWRATRNVCKIASVGFESAKSKNISGGLNF